MDELLYAYNPWWDGTYGFPGIPRKQYLKIMEYLDKAPGVVFITGMRRVGKTTLMHQYIHGLLKTVDPTHILYASLDNVIFQKHSMQEIVRVFRRINDLERKEAIYIFFDEVHYMKQFELELKNLYDMGNISIFSSGSASLDITMQTPHLTGRQRILMVHPLSFPEFLQFTEKRYHMEDQHLYENAALEYAKTGGLPEFVETRDPNVLQSIVDTILFRDILARNRMRDRENLKNVLMLLAQSVSTPISAARFARILKMNTDTVRMILNLLIESNLIHAVERHGKISERKASPKKYYLSDTGLFPILTERINLGAIVENLVYITLMKSGTTRYYKKAGREIDFIQEKHAYESKYKSTITFW